MLQNKHFTTFKSFTQNKYKIDFLKNDKSDTNIIKCIRKFKLFLFHKTYTVWCNLKEQMGETSKNITFYTLRLKDPLELYN